MLYNLLVLKVTSFVGNEKGKLIISLSSTRNRKWDLKAFVTRPYALRAKGINKILPRSGYGILELND